MANPKDLIRLQNGVAAWNSWRNDHLFHIPDLSQAVLNGAALSGGDLGQANLSGADLNGADLRKANLSRADLSEIDLSIANLTEANLTQAFSNSEVLKEEKYVSTVHRSRALFRNARLKGADLSQADLSGADLSGADLRETTLFETRLTSATLADSNLQSAWLMSTNLDHAILTKADFEGAQLYVVSLLGADLAQANLESTVLKHVLLDEANLRNAIFNRTILADVDLSNVRGLNRVHHDGPSTIGIDTVYASRGRIHERFLRGAGVADVMIAFASSLVANPIEFYSCFISYSTKDQDFADRLYADLQAKGVRCWFAPRDAQRGRKLHEQIDEAIRVHEKLLLILSPHSMNSNWVKTEIANTRAREQREGMQMLFPVSIVPYSAIREWKYFDADAGIDSAREIREYLIADFSNWKDHDSYQKEFDLLLRDLQSKRKINTAS